MTGRGYASVTRGRRPDHVVIRARSTLAQLEAATRATYRGVPVVPAGAPIWDWRVCGCDYAAPLVDGKRVRQADDPMFQWGEEQSRTGRLKSLAEEVRRLVLLYGLGYFHAKDSFRMFPGHPDCLIWGAGLWVAGVQVGAGPRRKVRELKPAHDWKFYGPQLATLTTMRLAGDDVGVWNSCCLLSGRISAELREIAGVVDPHPEDIYGQRAPGGRPAESGIRYDPGTIEPDPPAADPMGGVVPMGERVGRRPTRAAAAAAAPVDLVDVVDELGAGVADGYVINPVGTVDELQARAIGRLRAWAVDWGIERCDLVWPMSMVITDDRYWVHVRDRSAGPNGRRWHEITRLATSPVPVVELVESLQPRHVTADTARRCMTTLAPNTAPGGMPPATQGDPK